MSLLTANIMCEGEPVFYFEVGDSSPRLFVGTSGKLVTLEDGTGALRKFVSLKAANDFFELMNGRYGGERLDYRTCPWPMPVVLPSGG